MANQGTVVEQEQENFDLLEEGDPNQNPIEQHQNVDGNGAERDDYFNEGHLLDYETIIAEFLLELRENFGTSTKATCFVSEKLLNLLEIDRKQHSDMFFRAYQYRHPDNPLEYEPKAILFSNSPFEMPCKKFCSEKALSQFIKQKESYVDPIEIILGVDPENNKQDTMQYIPILKTLDVLLKHEDVLSQVLKNPHEQSGRLASFADSENYKKNKLFQSSANCLEIILYHDDFGTANPLGNKVSKYKISAFYFVLGNIPAKFRSRLKDINLLLLSPSSFVQKYGYVEILQPCLDDLIKLETIGIKVRFENIEHLFKGTLSMVIADNLAAHALGGFFCNFSRVRRFCRFCNCSRDQLSENIKINQVSLRTEKGYDNNIKNIEQDPSLTSVYGIKTQSCLHVLKYFHVVNGLPPDLAHDAFEGLAVDILSECVGYFLEKGMFTLSFLNDQISSFKYSNQDKKNKVEPFKIVSGQTFKIKQTACEMWALLRLFPLFIGTYVNEGDPVWETLISFIQIIEKLCAMSFNKNELCVLTFYIEEFFSKYGKLFPETSLKPKGHFLKHYPVMTKRFGPLVKTLRFEAKHSYFKGLCHNMNNRKNICQTLAKRHQFLMYLHYSKENLLEHEITGAKVVESPLEALSPAKKELLHNIPAPETVCEMDMVHHQGYYYYLGDVVVSDFEHDEFVFGVIDSIVSFEGNIYLICEIMMTSRFYFHFNAYEINGTGRLGLFRIDELLDSQPLSKYDVNNKSWVQLKHHIPTIVDQ